MIITRFKATSFRNIESCDIELSPGLNLLHGKNAQGKTNALEGIYIFSRGKSFRAREDSDLIRFGSDGFYISIEYESRLGKEKLEYSMSGKERQRKKNGYKLSSVSEMLGSFRSVLFFPDNLEIVKGGPEERRNLLNIAISQCDTSYLKYYSGYKKALENRNCLLKLSQKGFYTDERELRAWSESMADYASYIYVMRKDYVERISPHTERIMKEISDESESITLSYISDIDVPTSDRAEVKERYLEKLTGSLDRERAAGVTLFGPHRDELRICLNGNDTRIFSSQGQQRSVVLALKLAEGEVIRERTGEYPVYLFDDVLSELDERRRGYVLGGSKEKQIIITSCESEEYERYGANIIEVSGGEYVPSHR